MPNKTHTDVEGYTADFDNFLDKFTGKHEKDNWLKQSLYADTVQVRKDLIVKEFQSILQSQADKYERQKKEMVREILKIVDGHKEVFSKEKYAAYEKTEGKRYMNAQWKVGDDLPHIFSEGNEVLDETIEDLKRFATQSGIKL
jgi:hypothetical protein